jgi:hypothetical protein
MMEPDVEKSALADAFDLAINCMDKQRVKALRDNYFSHDPSDIVDEALKRCDLGSGLIAVARR